MKPDTADVAVVGAGVIGLSVARELMKAGAGRVTVLEAAPGVGQGSSSRANGGFRAQFTTRPNIEFSRWSIDEFERLEAATGLLSMHQTGYLLFTGTEQGEAGLRAAFELQRSLGVGTQWLSPEEVVANAPFVRETGLRAGTFHPRDGFLDPAGVVSAMSQEARELGARIVTNATVRGIAGEPGGGFMLEHASGLLRASRVVNAAGADARRVGAMLGIEVPVTPYRRNLAHVRGRGETGLAERGLTPMCVDLDTGVLVRREAAGGWIVAYSNPDDAPTFETGFDPAFLEDLAERVPNRFPFISELPIDPAHCWAGLYPETPDHHAVVSDSVEVTGFLQCVGFGGHGVMHSPAAGRAIAELITRGRCETFDLHPLRLSRFDEGELIVETAVL